MGRSVRILAALMAAGALLFAQFAVASFACPGTAMAAAAPEASDNDCHRDQSPSLCQAHCTYGAASVDMAKPFPVLGTAARLEIRLTSEQPVAGRSFAPAACLARATGPPPLVLFGALRI